MSGEKRGRTERKKRDGEHPCIDPSILIDYHFYFILFCCIRHGIHQTQDWVMCLKNFIYHWENWLSGIISFHLRFSAIVLLIKLRYFTGQFFMIFLAPISLLNIQQFYLKKKFKIHEHEMYEYWLKKAFFYPLVFQRRVPWTRCRKFIFGPKTIYWSRHFIISLGK